MESHINQILESLDRLAEQERRLTELLIKINAAIDELVQCEQYDNMSDDVIDDEILNSLLGPGEDN